MAPITFAHRGGLGPHPPSTLEAFASALGHGATGLETDAWVDRDGEVVLRHDEWVWARRGPIPWRWRIGRCPPGQLAARGVLPLRRLLTELGSDYELSVDLKAPGIGGAVGRVAREHGDPTRLWLCSGSPSELEALRAELPEVRLVHSSRRTRVRQPLERHAATLHDLGVDAMNMPHVDWSAGLVSLFRRFGVRAFAWDVQEVRHLRAMVQIGVDGLYSDHVERMVEIVADAPDD